MRSPVPTLRRAKQLRRALTPPEARLWVRLRTRTANAPAFRRQVPFGPYVLDFYCAEAKLAVEIDGWGHNMGDRPERDEARDAWLESQGVRVIRITASDLLQDFEDYVDRIEREAAFAALTRTKR